MDDIAQTPHGGDPHGSAAPFTRAARWARPLPPAPASAALRLALIDDDAVRGVAAAAADEGDVLNMLASDTSRTVRARVASNSAASVETQHVLAAADDVAVLEALASNPSLDPTVASTLRRLTHPQVDHALRRSATWAPDPSTWESASAIDMELYAERSRDAETLRALAGHSSRHVRGAVAANESTAPATLNVLSRDSEHDVRAKVASNAASPPLLLDDLARDADYAVRFRVASHPATWPSTLRATSSDAVGSIRGAVAGHPSFDSYPEMKALSGDADFDVRCALVPCGVFRPTDIVERLAADPDEIVRAHVAQYDGCPPRILAGLAGDTPSVRRAVARNDACPPELLKEFTAVDDLELRFSVARHRSCPPSALTELAKRPEFRADVAAHHATPEWAFLEIMRGDDWEAREAVVRNPATPPSVLWLAVEDIEPAVRAAAAENRHAPPQSLDALSFDDDPYVAAAVAANPSTEPGVLARLAHSDDAGIRYCIAANPRTPLDALRRIETSGDDPWIRAAAIISACSAAPSPDPSPVLSF